MREYCPIRVYSKSISFRVLQFAHTPDGLLRQINGGNETGRLTPELTLTSSFNQYWQFSIIKRAVPENLKYANISIRLTFSVF